VASVYSVCYIDQLMLVASLQRNGAKLFTVGTSASLVSLPFCFAATSYDCDDHVLATSFDLC
jgi:hypothetical protein